MTDIEKLQANNALFRDFIDYVFSLPNLSLNDFEDEQEWRSIYYFAENHPKLVSNFITQWEGD